MATWKKVYTTGDDVLVTDGGTGASSFTDGAAITAASGITTLALPASQIMVGTGTNPVASTIGGDITASGTTTLSLTINNNAVDADALADGTVIWEQHMKDDASYANKIATWNASGVATMLAPGSAGQILKYDGTNLVWDTAGAATTVTINTVSDSTEYPVVLKSGASAIAVDNTAADFTYNPSTNKLTAAGFIGDLTGTADKALNVQVNDGATQAINAPVLFSNNAVAGTDQDIMSDVADFNYNANTATLTVKNLVVDGTTTTLNVNDLTVDDANIVIAKNAGTQADAAAAALNPAVRVYVTQAGGAAMAESLYPQLSYAGSANTVTPTGWKLTKNTGDATSITTGVASMDYENVVGNATMSNASATAADIGIGAFKLCASGELWVQTA